MVLIDPALCMATLEILFIFFFLAHIATAACGRLTCATSGPTVGFPFRLADQQPSNCGYSSKFDLSCDKEGQTILTLPSSGDFTIKIISYIDQNLWINDRDSCIFKRFLQQDFSLHGSPFQYSLSLHEYTFYNCSSELVPTWSGISCLSSENYKVIALRSSLASWRSPSPFCNVTSTAVVPSATDELQDSLFGLKLTWDMPDCRSCVASGMVCRSHDGLDSKVLCSSTTTSSYGLSKATKYGIAICVILPGILCIACCGLFCTTPRRDDQLEESYGAELSSSTPRQPRVVIVEGLDDSIIESYAKTQLGDRSLELPDPNDKTCPICLSEYKSLETLRTIPKCNHYFHASCIDEWLRNNPTCPLCRNLPQVGGVMH